MSVALWAAYSVSTATHVVWHITVRTIGEEAGLVVWWLAGGLLLSGHSHTSDCHLEHSLVCTCLCGLLGYCLVTQWPQSHMWPAG